MDIVSGMTANLEILGGVSDIADNPKTMEIIEERIDKLPDMADQCIEVSLIQKWKRPDIGFETDVQPLFHVWKILLLW